MHPAHPEQERRFSERYSLSPHDIPNRPICALHDLVQLRVDLVHVPLVLIQILCPLEVRADHTPCVDEDIRQNIHSPLVQDGVCFRSHRVVCCLHDDRCLDTVGIVIVYDAFDRRGNQRIAVDLQQLRVGNDICARKVGKTQSLPVVLGQSRNIEAARIVYPSLDAAHRDDLASHLMRNSRSPAAYLSKALHDDPSALHRKP